MLKYLRKKRKKRILESERKFPLTCLKSNPFLVLEDQFVGGVEERKQKEKGKRKGKVKIKGNVKKKKKKKEKRETTSERERERENRGSKLLSSIHEFSAVGTRQARS